MSALGIHGDPGTGKTIFAIQEFIIPALKKGVKVYTNIEGLQPHLVAVHFGLCPVEIDDLLQVWDFDDKRINRYWEHIPEYENCLCVWDESQDYWYYRDWSSKDNKDHVKYLARHRHFGKKIIFISPSIDSIDAALCKIIELLYSHKSLSVVGRNKSVSCAVFSGTNISKQPLKTFTWKHNVLVYLLYDSYAGEEVKEEKNNINILKDPKLIFFLLVSVVSMSYAVVNLKKSGFIGEKSKSQPKTVSLLSSNVTIGNERYYVSRVVLGDSALYTLDNGRDTVALVGAFSKRGL